MAKPLTPRKENSVMGLTWPIFIELLLQMLVGNADQAMVGGVDPNGVGAIGNANQITNLLILVFSVICTASMILVSQYIGAKDTKSVNQTYTVSVFVNLLFGLAVSVVLMLLCGPMFRLMGVHEEIFETACTYMRIVGAGMVFQALYLTFTAFFRSSQMMRDTMVVSVCINLLNIGGNYLLINGIGPFPQMGVMGAAVSSSLSRMVGMVVIIALFRYRFGRVIQISHLRPFPKRLLRRLLCIGLPTGGESLSYNLSQVSIQTVCNQFQTYVVNTRVYANMFASITYMFGSAMSQAAQVVVARLMGGGDPENTDRQVKRTLLWSLLISGTVSVLVAVLCRPVFGLFTQDENILLLAQTIMIIEIPLELGRAVNMTICRALQACGDIRFPIVICIISAWLVAVGGSLVLGVALGWGLAGLWVSMAADECFRALLFLWRWHSRKWMGKQLLS